MRTLFFAAPILGLLASPSAFAGMSGGGGSSGYMGLRGSYVEADNQSATSISIDDERAFASGWGLSGFIGFILTDALRAEFEGGYRITEIDAATVTRNTLFAGSVSQTFQADGQVDMSLAMVNLYYDLHMGDLPFLPWVGVGLGGAHVEYQVLYDYDGAGVLNPVSAKDSDWQFAYQLMAGVTAPVAEAVSVSLGYRYFSTEDMVFTDSYGGQFETGLTNHSVDVGLQFHL
jgi:opacity protein-like surface antigen